MRNKRNSHNDYGITVFFISVFLTLILIQQCEMNEKLRDIRYEVESIDDDLNTIENDVRRIKYTIE